MGKRLFDITRPVRTGFPVWPGDPPFQVEWAAELAHGAGYNLSALRLNPHTGSHADAPYHVDPAGLRIGGSPLEVFIGPARVVSALDWPAISAARVARVLDGPPVERILFHTGCWSGADRLPTRFAALEPEAAELLANAGVRLVGTDAPSVDPFDSVELPTHHVLCRRGLHALESLLLDDVPPGEYELIALPLRLEEAEASPVRAVLRELG
jgi:arylformamidase